MSALPDLTPDELDSLESVAIDVARACGALIVDERPEALEVAATKSSTTDIVTEMDQRSEQLAREMLLRRRPADSVFGEEGSDTVGSSPITWAVDPIDGTVNYLYGLPEYAVSVAAVVGDPRCPGAWRPVAGAVFVPATGELFHAARGSGAHLVRGGSQQRLRVGTVTDLAAALVATGFGYTTQLRTRQARLVADLLSRVRDIRRAGSAALDLCSVAAGRLDAQFESNLNPWDVAAGWIIIEEAGGVVTDLDGQPPNASMTLAGNRHLNETLQLLLRDLSPA